MRTRSFTLRSLLWFTLAVMPAACQSETAKEKNTASAARVGSEVSMYPSDVATEPPEDKNDGKHLLAHKTGKVNHLLEAPLPRKIVYRGLRFTVSKGTLSDLPPSGERPDAGAGLAYCYLDLSIHNELDSTIFHTIDSNLLKMELGDGTPATQVSEWSVELKPKGTERATLVYSVPAHASWKGAKLLAAEAEKEPAILSLDGPVATSPYSVSLPVPAHPEATVAPLTYKVLSAALDVEFERQRSARDCRFLILTMRVVYDGPQLTQSFFGDQHFHLLVDGAPEKPVNNIAQNLTPKSATQFTVAFSVPATLGAAELQLDAVQGENAKPAKIPISLAAIHP
jgi:hypothetical protein